MKIISKYKDYYDYLQGIYGIDEKLILDRTKGTTKMFPKHDGLHILVICGKILQFFCLNNKFYFGKEIAKFNEDNELNKWSLWKGPKPIYVVNPNTNPKNTHFFTKIHYPELSEDTYNLYPELKEISKNCPIFLYHSNSKTIWVEFPSLLELGASKLIDPIDIWILLSEWLGQRVTEKEPEVPVGDDKVRILSAGFDLKTSFRH